MSQINIENLTIDKFYLGDSSNLKIYLGEIKLYPTYVPPTPSGNCYEIISTPITSYTSTDYSSVYSFADKKWYMLNNLNQYEEYGIYETGTSLSDFTYYPNKLVIIGETEYQYQTNGWVDVGNYIDVETSYQVTRDTKALRGNELPTTFKIPFSDIRDIGGHLDLRIATEDGSNLDIRDNRYYYDGSDGYYRGTVTNDNEYYYYSLPSEAPSSVIIEFTDYHERTPIHLIFVLRQISVQYAKKEVPTAKVYNTVEEMEALGCPTVGVNEYAFVGNNLYKYFANEQWNGVTYYDPKMVAFYENGNPLVVYENGSGDLTKTEVKINDISPISVYIGDNVISIGNYAFQSCTSLTSVTMPENSQLISINNFAFDGCTSLTSVTMPDSITSIGGSAFGNCTSLTSVTIPSGVTSISGFAFDGCTSLTSITIPSGVTSIGNYAFKNTPWWNTYSADTSHHYGNIIYINDVAYTATSSGITSCTFREGTVSISDSAFKNCTSLTSVTIPSGVTSIGDSTFDGCTSLTSVTIPDSITSIGDSTFQSCTSLTSVTIPSSVTSIDTQAFNKCTSLTSVTMPDSITSIGGLAFQNCTSLTSITIPSGVTSIGIGAFRNCSGLTSITVEATTPPTLDSFVFDNTNNCPIYVPAESVDAYKSATNWSSLASRIQSTPTE